MSPSTPPTRILDSFLTAADAAAASRPDVDGETAREVMAEAARLLHDSLALDHLDDHDQALVVDALAGDPTALDPTAAVRARAAAVAEDDPDLHDADGIRAAYLASAQVLGL